MIHNIHTIAQSKIPIKSYQPKDSQNTENPNPISNQLHGILPSSGLDSRLKSTDGI